MQQELYEPNKVGIKVTTPVASVQQKEVNDLDLLLPVTVQSICLNSQTMTEYDYIENDERPLDINENLSYFS
jgi:hypothetical protein